MKAKRDESKCVCPRCGYRLSPVFRRKDPARRPVAYCCPEPYCDFAEVVPGSALARVGRTWLPWVGAERELPAPQGA